MGTLCPTHSDMRHRSRRFASSTDRLGPAEQIKNDDLFCGSSSRIRWPLCMLSFALMYNRKISYTSLLLRLALYSKGANVCRTIPGAHGTGKSLAGADLKQLAVAVLQVPNKVRQHLVQGILSYFCRAEAAATARASAHVPRGLSPVHGCVSDERSQAMGSLARGWPVRSGAHTIKGFQSKESCQPVAFGRHLCICLRDSTIWS